MSASLGASTSVTFLTAPNGSHGAAIASIPSMGANEQRKEQILYVYRRYVTNDFRGATADVASHQLGMVHPRKSVFVSRLSSCTPKEVIVKY